MAPSPCPTFFLLSPLPILCLSFRVSVAPSRLTPLFPPIPPLIYTQGLRGAFQTEEDYTQVLSDCISDFNIREDTPISRFDFLLSIKTKLLIDSLPQDMRDALPTITADGNR